jgi:hypothetical protein
MAESGMAGIPGIGAMTDTLEFVKNLWGGMKIPGMAMPSLSVDDINKQISDLKTVEAWLNVNMNMLRSTIQALEVQSATLAALQSMSESMASMVQPGTPAKPNGPSQPAAGAAATSNPAPNPPSFNFAAPTADKPTPPGAQPSAPPAASALPQAGAIGMENAATFANPAAWWNLLQDQFRQAVSTAVTPESRAEKADENAASGKDAPKPKTRTKPKAESASAPAPRKRTPKA